MKKNEKTKKTLILVVGVVIGYLLAPRGGKVEVKVVEKETRVEVPVEKIVEKIVKKRVVVNREVVKYQTIYVDSCGPKVAAAAPKKNRVSLGLGSSKTELSASVADSLVTVETKRALDLFLQYQRKVYGDLSVGGALTGNGGIYGTLGLDF